jgi:hypothetical protein
VANDCHIKRLDWNAIDYRFDWRFDWRLDKRFLGARTHLKKFQME